MILGITLLVFLVLQAAPGDQASSALGDGASEEAKQQYRQDNGLNDPLVLQYFRFLGKLLQFDLGTTTPPAKSVASMIGSAFPLTLQLTFLGVLIAIVLSLAFGILGALYRDKWQDQLVRVFSIAAIATPSFWLGIMSLVLVLDITYLATGKPWLPPIDYVPFWKDPLRNLSMVALPAITVGYRYSAVTMRMTRSAMLEVMREDYIRTARSKGLLEQIIVNRHALKNALLPVVTLIGIEFAFLIGGLVVTEQVFNINGIGRLFVQAVLFFEERLRRVHDLLRKEKEAHALTLAELELWKARVAKLQLIVGDSGHDADVRP